MVKVFLGLGGNKEETREALTKAVIMLSKNLKELRCSSLYRTNPMYLDSQPPFFNAVVSGFTVLPASDLLKEINRIEAHLGRNRKIEVRNGQRSMDIDILLYGREIISTPDLTIPHPRIKERKFVLIPLLELENGITDPCTGNCYSEDLKKLPSQGIYYASLLPYSKFRVSGGKV